MNECSTLNFVAFVKNNNSDVSRPKFKIKNVRYCKIFKLSVHFSVQLQGIYIDFKIY